MKKYSIILLLLISISTLQAQDFALERLENSPRHHEWVKLKNQDRTVYNFVVYPEVAEKVPVVIVIHENRGLNDWARSFADQVAEAGYIAIAPDLLSETVPGVAKTSDFANDDAARNALYELKPEQVKSDLDKAFEYAKSLPASNGKVIVVGFCWGGSQSFNYATHNPNLEAALVFYGTGPQDDAAYATIKSPVYGFYGGNDARVNATIEKSAAAMKAKNQRFVYEIFDGAGHAYMRSGDDPNGSEANKAARDQSWQRLARILNSLK
ncbi:dienelactone hydrolase family protein [Penaeicola halotolerans]|uniref:dienelactone hydrolase family protein n=1 Tax=Penaeicola halotolerans TaxID=2793196 RepID=UPI001CF7F3A8|nr:dienelactone hydrolase family protein [Penaeicola halotolerans]